MRSLEATPHLSLQNWKKVFVNTVKMLTFGQNTPPPSIHIRGVCQTQIHMGPEPKSCSWVYLVRNVVKNLNLTNFYVDNFAIQDLTDFLAKKQLFSAFFGQKIGQILNGEVVNVEVCQIQVFHDVSYLIHPTATFRLGSR